MPQTIHIVTDSPERRYQLSAPVVDRQVVPLRTPEQLLDALGRHTGREDVPACTEAAAMELKYALRARGVLYQIRLTMADRQPRRLGFGTRFAACWTLSKLLCCSVEAVRYAMRSGAVETFTARPAMAKRRYVVYNRRLIRWAFPSGEVLRTVRAGEIDLPRSHDGFGWKAWFGAADVEEAIKTGLLRSRNSRLVIDQRWLHWALEKQPEAERRRILRAQTSA